MDVQFRFRHLFDGVAQLLGQHTYSPSKAVHQGRIDKCTACRYSPVFIGKSRQKHALFACAVRPPDHALWIPCFDKPAARNGGIVVWNAYGRGTRTVLPKDGAIETNQLFFFNNQTLTEFIDLYSIVL
jgi:hypothetical protein